MKEQHYIHNMLPFDTASKIDIDEIISLSKSKANGPIKGGVVRLKTLIKNVDKLKAPYIVCDYFSVPYDINRDGEYIWQKVEDIKLQIFTDLGNLIGDNNDYLCEFDEDGSFALFMRKK